MWKRRQTTFISQGRDHLLGHHATGMGVRSDCHFQATAHRAKRLLLSLKVFLHRFEEPQSFISKRAPTQVSALRTDCRRRICSSQHPIQLQRRLVRKSKASLARGVPSPTCFLEAYTCCPRSGRAFFRYVHEERQRASFEGQRAVFIRNRQPIVANGRSARFRCPHMPVCESAHDTHEGEVNTVWT